MIKTRTFKSMAVLTFAALLATSLTLAAAGCAADNKAQDDNSTGATTAETTQTQTQGFALDPDLKSVTGLPAPEEMKTLMEIQAKMPYPVIVPTGLPGDYSLETDLVGFAAPSERDPVGYYNFKYSDPSDVNKVLTFNQSKANDKSLPGYYLTKFNLNGTEYLVYWHENRNYLPTDGPAVEIDEVGVAEAFVIIWKDGFTDTSGQKHVLYYGLTTGTDAYDWEEMKSILAGLKPLGSVGQ